MAEVGRRRDDASPRSGYGTRGLIWTSTGLAAFGLTIGYLTGSSGPDSTVLAALLPAILSVLAAAAAAGILVKEAGARDRMLVSGGVGLLIFSVALVIAIVFSVNNRISDDLQAYADAEREYYRRRWRDLKDHHQRLTTCIEVEIRLNEVRKKFELPPLGPEQVCPPHIARIPAARHPE